MGGLERVVFADGLWSADFLRAQKDDDSDAKTVSLHIGSQRKQYPQTPMSPAMKSRFNSINNSSRQHPKIPRLILFICRPSHAFGLN
jgi:hypothetical protein